MSEFSMENYQPYSPMGKTCMTRPIQKKKIIWPYLETQRRDDQLEMRMIGEKDFEKAAEFWRTSYPEIY